MESIVFNIKGVMHRPKKIIKMIANELGDGDELILEKELNNKYDAYAVKVFFNDEWIGYVERDYSREVSELIDSDKTFECKVLTCLPDWDIDFTDSGKEIEIIADIDLIAEIKID